MPMTDTTLKAFVRRCMNGMPGVDDNMLAAELRTLIAAAVAEEREACAEVAESTVMTFAISQSSQGIQGVIAAAIRGRGTP